MVLIPILGEALLETIDLITDLTFGAEALWPLVAGFLGAFIAGCSAFKFMINLVKQGKLIYFAIYCFWVGAFTLIYSLI